MLVAEQVLRVEQRRVLGQRLAVHQQVLPVHVHLHVRDPLGAQRVDHVKRHPDVAHEDLHRRLGVLVLEEEERPALGTLACDLADAVDETGPRVAVRRLERVVVALDAWPEDHLRSDLAGEACRSQSLGQRVRAHRVVGRRQAALAEARVEMRTGTDGVDAVPAERLAHVVEVLLGQLLRVVELVVVDQLAQAVDGPLDPPGGGLAGALGLVATRDEPRDHRPEGPDAETRLRRDVSHARTLWVRYPMPIVALRDETGCCRSRAGTRRRLVHVRPRR